MKKPPTSAHSTLCGVSTSSIAPKRSPPTLSSSRRDGALEKKLILRREAYSQRADLSDCMAVSHRWLDPKQPDQSGEQFEAVKAYLRRHPKINLVWYDYWCMPQGAINDQRPERATSSTCCSMSTTCTSACPCSSCSTSPTNRASGRSLRHGCRCNVCVVIPDSSSPPLPMSAAARSRASKEPRQMRPPNQRCTRCGKAGRPQRHGSHSPSQT